MGCSWGETRLKPDWPDLGPKWVRMAQIWDFFQIRFGTFWLGESDLKKIPGFVPFGIIFNYSQSYRKICCCFFNKECCILISKLNCLSPYHLLWIEKNWYLIGLSDFIRNMHVIFQESRNLCIMKCWLLDFLVINGYMIIIVI